MFFSKSFSAASIEPATALLVVLLTRSLVVLKTTGYHPKVCCPLSCTPQTNYRPKVRCLLSVVRCPFRTKQPSRGYQRGRANAKTTVLPATYGNLCTSVWFCKDTKTEIAIVHLCPFMSTYVHLFLLKHTIANIYKIGYLHRLATRCS